MSDTQAGIAEIDSSSAVTGHELAEIDLTAPWPRVAGEIGPADIAGDVDWHLRRLGY